MTPRPIEKGDRIAIVSPASAVDPALIDGACRTIESRGYEPVVMPHAKGRRGTYSGTADERFDDLSAAFLDPSIRAIVCSRGGYGAVHLLERLDRYYLEADPKWLVGFSDISALHALMRRHKIVSLHASMCKGLCDSESESTRRTFELLEGGENVYTLPSHPLNRPGDTSGVLLGGNLAVLQALIDTRFDDLQPDSILVIEDIAEPIYKVERILNQLRLSDRLERLNGLIVGQFTEYKSDSNHDDMYAMIAEMVEPYDFAVAFDAPFGHIAGNMPLRHGASSLLTVTANGVTLHN